MSFEKGLLLNITNEDAWSPAWKELDLIKSILNY